MYIISSFIKKNIFTLFYFTILYWFCHTSTWIRHGCTWVPNPEPPSHLSPHIISLGHPGAPAPSILYPVSNLDWRFISYLILYMFQCHSPKSSRPLPLPQSPEFCSIHYSTFEALVVRGAVRHCWGEEPHTFCCPIPAQALQFLVHLIDLLSILLRCNGFAAHHNSIKKWFVVVA